MSSVRAVRVATQSSGQAQIPLLVPRFLYDVEKNSKISCISRRY